jgi:hypothetical protein
LHGLGLDIGFLFADALADALARFDRLGDAALDLAIDLGSGERRCASLSVFSRLVALSAVPASTRSMRANISAWAREPLWNRRRVSARLSMSYL